MSIKSRIIAVAAGIALMFGPTMAISAEAASVKASVGASCSVVKKTVKVGKTALVCKKNARGKLVWTRAASVTAANSATINTTAVAASAYTFVEPEPLVFAAPNPTPTSPSGFAIVLDPNAGGSNEVVVRTPEEAEEPVVSNPAAVTNLRIVSVADNSVVLTHDTVAGISNYSVYLRYGDSYTLKGTDDLHRNVEFSDLTADWSYVACVYYRVNNVESNKSCINVHTTGSRAPEPVQQAGPSSITLSATENTISASWNAVAGASWYALCHVRVDSWQCGGYTMLTETSAIFQDGSVSAGWRYGVQITAVFADGTRSLPTMAYVTSAGSQPAPPTKYAAPTNLRVIDLTPNSVTVAWDDPANSPVSFWSVTTRHLTSYSQSGVDANSHQFTSNSIWPGGGFEIIVSGFDSVNGKWTNEAKVGFYAPTN